MVRQAHHVLYWVIMTHLLDILSLSKDRAMVITNLLKQKFKEAIVDSHNHYGNETVIVRRENLLEVLSFLKTNEQYPFNLFLDLCGVDYKGQDPRFEVVYHLYSLSTKARLRVRVKISEVDMNVPSCVKIWEIGDWFEREAYEMFGFHFEGHPHLKKLLLWEEFQGYPLRKDYPMQKRQPIPEPLDIV